MCPTEAGFTPLLFGSTTRSIERRCSCRRGSKVDLAIEGRRDRTLWRSELTRGDVGQESDQRRTGLHRAERFAGQDDGQRGSAPPSHGNTESVAAETLT